MCLHLLRLRQERDTVFRLNHRSIRVRHVDCNSAYLSLIVRTVAD